MKKLIFLLITLVLLGASPSCKRSSPQQKSLEQYVESMERQIPIILSPFGIARISYDVRRNIVKMDWDYATKQPDVNHYDLVQNVKSILDTPRLQQLCSQIISAGADLRITVRTKYDTPSTAQRVIYLSNYDLSQLVNDLTSIPPAKEIEPLTTPEEDEDETESENETEQPYVAQARKDQITNFLIKKNQGLPKLLDDGIWLELYQTDDEGIELSINYSIDEYYYDIEAFKDIDLWIQMRQAILNDLRKTETGAQQAKELFNRIRVRFTGNKSHEQVDYTISTTEI